MPKARSDKASELCWNHPPGAKSPLFPVCALVLALGWFGILGTRAAAAEQQEKDPHAGDKSEFVITSTNTPFREPRWDVPRIQKAGNLAGHVAFLKLRNCLTEGTVYSGQFSLRDPDNKEVPIEEDPKFHFTASAPNWNLFRVYTPPFEKQKPGKWKWSVAVDKIGVFSQEITVEPLTPQEERGLRRYEQAREAALLAFGHYWVGVVTEESPQSQDGSENTRAELSRSSKSTNFFTAIVTEDFLAKRDAEEAGKELEELKKKAQRLEVEKEAAAAVGRREATRDNRELFEFQSRHPEWNVTWMFTDNYSIMPRPRDVMEVRSALAHLPAEEAKIREKIRPLTNVCYVEIRGLTPVRAISSPYLTEADGLNGITYRGSAMFGFRVYRFYQPGSGWTEWYDAAFVPEHLSGVFSRAFGALLDSGAFPNLSFSMLQKDGHWRVTTESGDLFVDGNKLDQAGAAPRLAGVFVPQSAAIREFLRTGKNPRDADKALAEWVRKNPKELEDQVRETIGLARGKAL